MTKVGAFLAGFAVAAAAAGGAWWFVLAPRWGDFEKRTAAAERVSEKAKRDASDYLQWAEKEQRRRRELETETDALRKAVSAEPPKEGPHPPPRPPQDDDKPESWLPERVSREVERLALQPNRITANPRYELVMRALKAKPEESFQNLSNNLAQPHPKELRAVLAVLLGAMGDERAAKPLLEAWMKADKEPDVRLAVLRGLANAPGDEQVPVLVATWNDEKAEAFARKLALHGLARRKHEIALGVVAGDAPGAPKPLRAQAMETLHSVAKAGEWKDVSLVPLFGKALRTAAGDVQQRIALLSLEGFWSRDSVADLEAFAASAASTELAARARRDAEAIAAGKPRPEGAGLPPSSSTAAPSIAADPVDTESPPPQGKSTPVVPPKDAPPPHQKDEKEPPK